MKKFILLFVCLLCAVVVRADDEPSAAQADNMGCSKVRNFQLFDTGEHTFYLNLDTRNGRIWMIRTSVYKPDKVNEEVPINETPLASNNEPGRFWLYKATENPVSMSYLLLDKDTGKSWFVVASLYKEKLKFEELGPAK